MTPEEKLCSRSWRVRNSAGLLWSILSFGILTGVGFLIRGIKSKNKLWTGLGVGFLIVGIAVFTTAGMFDSGTEDNPNTSLGYDIWGWTMFTLFIGGVVSSIVTNKRWLLWKAHADDRKWYAKPEASQVPRNSAPSYSYRSEAVAPAFANPTSPVSNAPQTSHLPSFQNTASVSVPEDEIDVNTASVQDLVTALGVDTDTANRIVHTRSTLGSFTSFEQLMTRAQVQPHLLIPHRNKLKFGTTQATAGPHGQLPEPKSNPNARRLDI